MTSRNGSESDEEWYSGDSSGSYLKEIENRKEELILNCVYEMQKLKKQQEVQNLRDEDGKPFSDVVQAILGGDVNMVRLCFDLKLLPKGFGQSTPSPYLLAVRAPILERREIMDILFENGVPFDHKGELTLIEAIKLKHNVCANDIKHLIKLGVNYKLCDKEGSNALMHASSNGDIEIVDVLLTLGKKDNYGKLIKPYFDIIGDYNHIDFNAFFISIINGRFKLVQHFIDKYDVAFDCHSPTRLSNALHVCAMEKRDDSIQIFNYLYPKLVPKYYSIDSLNQYQRTPLAIAIDSQNIPIAKLLVELGANPKYLHHRPDCDPGSNILHALCQFDDIQQSTIDFVIGLEGVLDKINQKQILGITPIQTAIILENGIVLKTLLKQPQIDLNVIVKDQFRMKYGTEGKKYACLTGFNLLHLAAKTNIDIFKLIFNATNFNPNQQTDDEDGNITVYKQVIKCDNVDALRFLYEGGIKTKSFISCPKDHPIDWAIKCNAMKCYEYLVNERKLVLNRDTAFHMVAYGGGIQFYEKFIKLGCDPYKLNSNGQNILHILARDINQQEDWELKAKYVVKKFPKLLNSRDKHGRTSLFYASQAEFNHFKVLHQLGEKLITYDNIGLSLWLLLQFSFGDWVPQIVDYMIKNAKINIEERGGPQKCTLLGFAAVGCNMALLTHLWLIRGADYTKAGPFFTPINQVVLQSNNEKVIKFIYEQKRHVNGKMVPYFDPNQPATMIGTPFVLPLIAAIVDCKANSIRALLDVGADPQRICQYKVHGNAVIDHFFVNATRSREGIQELEHLLLTGIHRQNCLSSRKYTIIEECVARDNVEWLKHFIHHNNELYKFDPLDFHLQTGLSLLHTAILHNSINCMKYLLTSKSIPVDYQAISQSEYTPLQYAITKNKFNMVNVLVQYQPNVFVKTMVNNRTILHLAAGLHGISPELIQYLVQKYPQLLEMIDKNGDTPISLAVKLGNIESTQLLRKLGASLIIKTNDGSTLYHHCATLKNNGQVIINYLKDYIKTSGINDSLNNEHLTPFLVACCCGNLPMMKYFKEKCGHSCFNTITPNNWNVLNWVIMSDNIEAIKWVIEQQYSQPQQQNNNNNKQSKKGQQNNQYISSTLNKIIPELGQNTLHLAAMNSKPNAIKLLIQQYNIDPLIKTENSETIIDLAKSILSSTPTTIETTSSSTTKSPQQLTLEISTKLYNSAYKSNNLHVDELD